MPSAEALADLNVIVHEVADLLQPLTAGNIVWVIRLDPAAPQIKANSGQIHQTLVNLILNAYDAMAGGGTLTIETVSVRIDKPAAAEPAAKAGSYALLAITDSGAGFDENSKNHLFEPFFTTKQRSGGSGLGLATAHRIVTEADGWIRVDSEPGKGARIEIYLPQIERDSAMPGSEPV